ncbi:MAG: UDP-galactopyranose mutase [Lachnospiraceae bacterium]|nr:UDP-galactopyranose mutase [Lachnospiraceae bacterium]
MSTNHYDYLIVGSGLFGAVFAYEMKEKGKKCLVIEKRGHIGGNIYTEDVRGIHVHQYGAHIFHTANRDVWNYVNQFAVFNHYINSPVAVYEDKLYNLPFNMNTFYQLWGVKKPEEAKAVIAAQIADLDIGEPANLEEQALKLVGRDVYEKLIKGYTEKQWGRSCQELPAFIIRRLPLRFTYDNNYFNDPYQGIPNGGYTQMIEKMLAGTKVLTGISYKDFTASGGAVFDKILYTGMIDEFFDFSLGHLEYRSLRFATEVIPETDNLQGNAVVNYTERDIPYTRIIEHRHFDIASALKPGTGTVITKEYPADWKAGEEPYYPINDERNGALFVKYQELAKSRKDVIFGGRLGQYQYFNMDQVIEAALKTAKEQI